MSRKGSEKGGRTIGFSGGISPFPIITRSIIFCHTRSIFWHHITLILGKCCRVCRHVIEATCCPDMVSTWDDTNFGHVVNMLADMLATCLANIHVSVNRNLFRTFKNPTFPATIAGIRYNHNVCQVPPEGQHGTRAGRAAS